MSPQADTTNSPLPFALTLEGSRASFVPDDLGFDGQPRLPENPADVDPEAFYLHWRRAYHRLDFLYRIVKVLRSLASLGFETLREAGDEDDTLKALVAKLLPETVENSEVEKEVREDVLTMGRRPKEEQEASLDRPLGDDVLLRLNSILSKADLARADYSHFKKRQFFRHIGRSQLYAKKLIELLKEIEADRALVMRRRMQFGKKSA